MLEKLEREGLTWHFKSKPTEWVPTHDSNLLNGFPYALAVGDYIGWLSLPQLTHEEIVYDGRKEEHMSDKYLVSQKVMDKLEEWKGTLKTAFKPGLFVGNIGVETLPSVVIDWWLVEISDKECNNRLIAIIRWVNGEDVFEVEKPKKWVVKSKEPYVADDYIYYVLIPAGSINHLVSVVEVDNATRFDTKEEAESWANAHQEVVGVEQ